MMFTNFKSNGAKMILTAALAVSLSACETTPTSKPVSIDTAAAEKADFSPYQTYYVLDVPPGENEVAPPKPFSRVVVEDAVRTQFNARNYRESDNKDAADVLVAIQFSLKDETKYKKKTTYETQLNSYGGYGTGYGRGYGGSYGGYGGGYGNRGYGGGGYGNRYTGYSYGYGYRNYYGYTTIPRSTVVAEDFRQGNMLIDVIDRKTNAVVWEAHASGEGEHDPEKIKARVNMVVGRIFNEYPHQIPAATP